VDEAITTSGPPASPARRRGPTRARRPGTACERGDAGAGGGAHGAQQVVAGGAPCGGGEPECRFGDGVDGAGGERLRGGRRAGAGERRHHHHRGGTVTHQRAQPVEAVAAWHLHVQRHHVGPQGADAVDQFVAVAGLPHHLHASVGEHVDEDAAQQRGVVAHEHAGGH